LEILSDQSALRMAHGSHILHARGIQGRLKMGVILVLVLMGLQEIEH